MRSAKAREKTTDLGDVRALGSFHNRSRFVTMANLDAMASVAYRGVRETGGGSVCRLLPIVNADGYGNAVACRVRQGYI